MTNKLLEEAEAHLIMSEFAKAERLSKEALEVSKHASTSDKDLQSRACSIHLQALFEQGRVDEGDRILQTLFGSAMRAPFSIISLWILLRLEAGEAEAASRQLEELLDTAQQAEQGHNLSMSEYSAACQLLLIEIWCRDLQKPSHAAAWLEQDKRLEESAKTQLKKEIQDYEAAVKDQVKVEKMSAESSHRAADQEPTSSSSLPIARPVHTIESEADQSRRSDKQQLLQSSRSGSQKDSAMKGTLSLNQLTSSEQQLDQSSTWNRSTEDSIPSLVQGLGLAAAAVVVTYAAYAERHALSRGTSSAIKKIKEASEKAGIMEPRF